MTIAAGFVCNDGLIFASDTLYTELKKKYGQKFWIITRGNVVVVFGGSGTAPGLKRTRDILAQTIRANMGRHDVVRTIESALSYVEDLLKPTLEERTQALIGIRINQKYWLYENQGGRSALTVLGRRSHCVGAGYPLGAYFADTLFTSNMPMKWAKVVAAHLIKHVKIHNSMYCGGRTHIVELPATGSAQIVKDKNQITLLENYLAEVDEVARIILPDGTVSDETLDERMKRLTDAFRNLRKAHFIRLPAISSSANLLDTVVATSMSPALSGTLSVTGVVANRSSPATTPTEPATVKDSEVPPDPEDPKRDQKDRPPSPE